MKCPECEDSFPFTWARYLRAPLGRTNCPSCNVRLALKHRWFYWPAMVLGGALLGAPLAVLGHRLTGSVIVTIVAAGVGWLLSGVPADWYLESRFSIPRMVGCRVVYPLKASDASLENDGDEPKEEQA